MGDDAALVPVAYVNGKRHVLPPGRAEVTLLTYLRELGLKGTKLGCGEGGCGACTVMVSSLEAPAEAGGEQTLVHRAVNACLCPLYAVEGCHVVTVEGIGSGRAGLHPVQERLARAHGSQCGFCTPGFVMSMYSLLRSKPEAPTEEEIEEALAGNLCRCTGYRPILDAFKVFAKVEEGAYTEEAIAASLALSEDANNAAGDSVSSRSSTDGADDRGATSNDLLKVDGPDLSLAHGDAGRGKEGNRPPKENPPIKPGQKVCPSTGQPCDCGAGAPVGTSSDDKDAMYGSGMPARPTAEPIFPPELRRRPPTELTLPGPLATWHRPTSLESLLALKAKHPAAKLVVGNTEVGIEMKFKAAGYPHLVGTTHVPELNQLEVTEEGLRVGAAVPLTKMLHRMKELIATEPRTRTSTLRAVVEQLRWFAGVQIRNTACLGGNICTGSPISDLNPIWMACRATFDIAGQGTKARTVPARGFFLGYRKVDLEPHELLTSVFIPFNFQYEYVKEFKQAHRKDDDIAIANGGMRVKMVQDSTGAWVGEEVELAFGGVAAKTIKAPLTEQALTGVTWDQKALSAALEKLQQDVNITADAPGGMVEFRRSLAASFLFRFLVSVNNSLAADVPDFTSAFPDDAESADVLYERPAARGLQYFDGVGDSDVVGKPYRHVAADMQVTGEATYVDDIPLPANTLYAAVVPSARPHAKLLSVDTSEALKAEGVEAFFGAKDVPGDNRVGAVEHDEHLFADGLVTCVGQAIGVIVADTEAHARAAVRLVKVEYEDLPPIMSCADAIQANSYFEGWGHRIDCGDVDSVLEGGCDQVLQGDIRIGGQEHFYLETNAAIVIPKEHDEFESFSSTQAPTKGQVVMHGVLGVPMHKIVTRTKRLGGGFGGKETRSAFINAMLAIPAYHLRRPIRTMLDRDEDMQSTGTRHPFYAEYKVGFTKEGVIKGLDLNIYNNAGHSLDLSSSIMDRALLHTDNSYRLGAVRAVGHLCKTNQFSNTAFRGFGGPQGMMVTEHWIDQIARTLGVTPEAVREANMYDENDVTHYGQVLDGCQVRPCWYYVKKNADFESRQKEIAAFNAKNRWRKRGMTLIPTKFGISFTTKFLNQAGALIHIYTDGTVLCTHGGVEMGQGLHTKIAQIVAHDLGIPLSSVYIAETATDKVPNASPTAASASSDMYGGAATDACRQLNERLKPYREKLAGKPFAEMVMAAHLDRVDLSAHGFYSTPDITGFGGDRPFNYFTHGAAATEVELDVLTGDFQIRRTDICMDLGASLNPAIDIGQVEGGFVQGMGWTCLEELVWGDSDHKWVRPAGSLFTRGPGTYKIPATNSIPVDFRVSLLRDAPNFRTPMAHSSKAVGEPPFFLGASTFFALKEAVYAARASAGHTGFFQLDSPATPERLRMACADHLTAPFAPPHLRCKISC